MIKKDPSVLVRVLVAMGIIYVGFFLIEMVNKPSITAKTINPLESQGFGCVNVVVGEYNGVKDQNNCCRLISQATDCELLDGPMRLEFSEKSKASEPEASYNAHYVCSADSARLYFSFVTYEYCELQGYRIILN